MKRVLGIGGIFFKSSDPDALKAWYHEHLGIAAETWGKQFFWRDADDAARTGSTTWSVMRQESDYFAPSGAAFMVNYIVEDLDGLLAALRAEGVTVLDATEPSEFGKFGWVLDPDGNKIELWQAPKTE